MGHFGVAALAFSGLQKIAPGSKYLAGLRSATIGVFQLAMAGKASAEKLDEALFALLACSKNDQKALRVISVIAKWCERNKVQLTHQFG